jgi:hypothetical protein
MTKYIGNIPVSSIQIVEITKGQEQDELYLVNEDSNVIVNGSEQAEQVQIDFTLLRKGHPEGLDVETQRDEVKELVSEDVVENNFEYNGVEYFLSVEDVSIPESSDFRAIRQGTINATALPWPKHFEDVLPSTQKRFGGKILKEVLLSGDLQSELYFEGESDIQFSLVDLDSFGESFGENFGAKDINLSVDKSLSSDVLFALYLGGTGFGDGFGKEFGFSKAELTVYSEGDYGYGSYGDQMYGLVVEEGDYSYANYNEGNYGE